jgi:glycosyltransferase involved in cell wall biosynthesis
MNEDRQGGLVNGNLPNTVFRHLEPTGVGVVDLDRSITPSTPDGREWDADQRDALLMVRLHGQPLALVHVDGAVGSLTVEELAAEIWRSAGREIKRHVERFGCVHTPEASDALLGGLYSRIETCPGGRPARPDASVAVILCTLGQEERLRRCLPSLLAQGRADLELVVVDNRPDSGEALRTVRAVAAEDSRVHYVAEPRVGLSVARNRGIRETDADLVAFTDDDVVADAGWLEQLVAPFVEPGVTAACGMVLPLELETEAQKRFEQYGGFSKGLEQRTYDLRVGRAARPLLYPFLGDLFGGGNSMAFRRKELLDAGGFDTALGAGSPTGGGEDIYALSTSVLRGGRVVYEPRSLCWHEHRKDDAGLHGQVFSYGIGLGAIMTKALSSDPRFYVAVARSVPTVLRSCRRSSDSADDQRAGASTEASHAELLRAHRRGIIRGPLRYAEGVVRAHRLGLVDVIRGK